MKSTLSGFIQSGKGETNGDRAGYCLDAADSPTYITEDDTFFATVRHYATLHRVDADHLVDTLLIVARRGEPVSAGQIFRTAEALALHIAGGPEPAPARRLGPQFHRRAG
jgi:hypothetical protein